LGDDLAALRELRRELHEARVEYERIKARRFYCWSERAARAVSRILAPFTPGRGGEGP
jgi:hypothetical protein